MSESTGFVQPVIGRVVDAIEDIVGSVPPSREHPVRDPRTKARKLARKAAARAAALSGTLALPPGLLGMLTVLPDLYLIWHTQRQMVADIFAIYGRTPELTRTHMLYCLFRHAASQVLRDVAVRAGERFIVREVSGNVLASLLNSIGLSLTQRIAGSSAGRWVPLVGAVAVGGYAYWDTMQVARTAQRLLSMTDAAAPG